MRVTFKVASIFLRVLELCSAVIVAALAGNYLNYVSKAGGDDNSRIVYSVALAGISIVAALVNMIPAKKLIYGFPLDTLLGILWMVSFTHLISVSLISSHFSCDALR